MLKKFSDFETTIIRKVKERISNMSEKDIEELIDILRHTCKYCGKDHSGSDDWYCYCLNEEND